MPGAATFEDPPPPNEAATAAPVPGPAAGDRSAADETKTHTLFMGADIAISLDKGLYPVRDVIGSSWVIDISGEERVVSAKQTPLSLKITPSLKLTDISATIAGYTRKQAYSFANDPSVRVTRGLDAAEATSVDLMSIANDVQHIADTASNKALGNAGLFATADSPLATGPLKIEMAAIAEAAGRNTTIFQLAADAVALQTQNGNEAGSRLGQTGLDAMEVEFDVASAKPLPKPYIVTVTLFHPKGSKPGTVQNLIFAKELHPIDAHPTHVHFVEGGFPYGFEVVDFQMHLYDRGREVATTVSSKRVPLTRDDAFEYIKIEYLAAHKGATLPAAPALALLPPELSSGLPAGSFPGTFYVRVSKDGRADGAFSDPICSKPIEDAYCGQIVRALRFFPALTKGNAVDGIASLNLAQLKI